MAWPTPQDYNEAVQNPRTCFSDPELRRGSPALTTLGLPKPISGAFASVYRLDCPGRRWAVRCFLREYADQRQRYSAISQQLSAAKLPCMVGFQFLDNGICIRGRWYPVLKMEWIEGEPLDGYISRNRNNQSALQALSLKWSDLVRSLRKADIAHGDLQHGNILVSGGELKLLDYDAMYVPALAGLQSHEVGHRNYQHPGRTSRDFGPDLDNFSSWVIATSISAQASSPNLWNQLHAGDECLLFRRNDFERPESSKALMFLDAAGDPEVVRIAAELRRIFNLPISKIPCLDGRIGAPGIRTSSPRVSKVDAIAGTHPDWLADFLVSQPIQTGTSPTRTPSVERTVEAHRLGEPIACSRCLNTMERFDGGRYRCKWCGST